MPRIVLHAVSPDALGDPALADLVRAVVLETAERQGVAPPEIEVHPDRIELAADRPVAILVALAAEVRRATGRWHRARHDAPLWKGEAR